jgi:IS5 family transposase
LHPYRTALLAHRAEAQTEAFRDKLHLRAGIEGTISELARMHGLRKARYRGLAKQRLQNYFIALAANLKRLALWWWAPQVAARVAGITG